MRKKQQMFCSSKNNRNRTGNGMQEVFRKQKKENSEMKPMKKRIVLPALFDLRGMILMKGDTVLVREQFPKTAGIKWGTLVNLRVGKDGQVEGKLKQFKEWYKNPLKLADK